MALTAGSWQGSTGAQINGATIAPQGNASPNTLTSPSVSESSSGSDSLSFGTTSGKGDIYCAVQVALGIGANVIYDIYTGTDVLDVYGKTAAFRTLRRIYVRIATGGDASGLTIGAPGSNGNKLFFADVSDAWTIFPTGPAFPGGSDAGVVVDATHKNIKFLNNGAVALTFDLFLAGGST